MRLSTIDIRRLGQIRDLSLGKISPNLTVVYGPNEAGKSTVRDAVRYALFGFPSSKPARDAVDTRPYLGIDREVALSFEGEGALRLDRLAEGRRSTAGQLTVSPAAAEPLYSHLVEGVDGTQYHTMWNVSLANLSGIDPSRDSDNVLSTLLAAEHGTAVSPTAAITKLEGELGRLFSPAGRNAGPSLKAAVDSVVTLRERLVVATREASAVASQRADLATVNDDLAAATSQRQQVRARLAAIAADAAELDRLLKQRPQLDTAHAAAQARYEEAQAQVAAADSPGTKLALAVADEVNSLEAQRSFAEGKRADADRLAEEIAVGEGSLQRYEGVPDVLDESEGAALVERLERLARQVARTEEDLAISRSLVEDERARTGAPADPAAPSGPKTRLLFSPPVLVLAGAGVVATIATYLIETNWSAAAVVGIMFATATVGFSLWLSQGEHVGGGGVASDDSRLSAAMSSFAARERAALEARAEWDQFVGAHPVLKQHVELDPEQLVALSKQSATKADLTAELEKQAVLRASALGVFEEWAARVDAVLQRARGVGDPPVQSLSHLSALVKEAERLAAIAASAGESVSASERALRQAETALVDHEAALKALLVRYSATSEAEARAVLATAVERAESELSEVDERITALDRFRGELSHAISTAETDRSVEQLSAELEAANEHLNSLTRHYVVTLLAKTILERGVSHFAGEGRPGVMDSAGVVLSQLTGGAYVGVDGQEDGGGTLEVVAADGTRKGVGELSVGTVEQLYLSLRIGALLALPNRGHDLPVLLDEILANYDEARSEYAYSAVASLARIRQTIFFTCREEVAAGLERAAAEQGIHCARFSIEGGKLDEQKRVT